MQKLRPSRRTLLPALALILVAGLTGVTYRGPGRPTHGDVSPAREQGHLAATASAERGGAQSARVDSVPREDRERLAITRGQLPLSFEPNAGQFEPGVGFAARGDGYVVSLKPTEAVLDLRGHSRGADDVPVSHAGAATPAGRRAPNRIGVRLAGA
ncbi:MAG TPA: hypothetical protein VIP46_15540, partial [Pyrinomonadaceae bacterium]